MIFFAIFSSILILSVLVVLIYIICNLTKKIYAIENENVILKELAFTDTLTGLLTRRSFEFRFSELLSQWRRSKGTLYILLIDLDNFKNVNDSFGHNAGDEILKVVASKLKSALRPSDCIARIGGDEFAALVYTDKNSTINIVEICNRIIHLINKPTFFNTFELKVGCSIGVIEHNSNCLDIQAEDLLSMADVNMYYVKKNRKNNFFIKTSL